MISVTVCISLVSTKSDCVQDLHLTHRVPHWTSWGINFLICQICTRSFHKVAMETEKDHFVTQKKCLLSTCCAGYWLAIMSWCTRYPALVADTWKLYSIFTRGLPTIPFLDNLLQNSIVMESLRKKLHEGAPGSMGNGGRISAQTHEGSLGEPRSFSVASTRWRLEEPKVVSHSSGAGRFSLRWQLVWRVWDLLWLVDDTFSRKAYVMERQRSSLLVSYY